MPVMQQRLFNTKNIMQNKYMFMYILFMNMYIVNYLNIMWVRAYSPTQLNIQQKVHILTLGPLFSEMCTMCTQWRSKSRPKQRPVQKKYEHMYIYIYIDNYICMHAFASVRT